MSRAVLEDRAGDAAERADERSLVPGGLHGGRFRHVRARADIHNPGYLRAAVAHDVRAHMGRGGPGRVQRQRVPVRQRRHRVQHNHREIRLPVLQMRRFRQRGGRKFCADIYFFFFNP